MTCNQTSTKYANCDKVFIEYLFQNTKYHVLTKYHKIILNQLLNNY